MQKPTPEEFNSWTPAEKLEFVAQWIEAHPEALNMSQWWNPPQALVNDCGTCGCIAGHLAHFGGHPDPYFSASWHAAEWGAELLNAPYSAVLRLFYAHNVYEWFDKYEEDEDFAFPYHLEASTPVEVVAVIRQFIREHLTPQGESHE